MSKASSYFLIENFNGKRDMKMLKSQLAHIDGVISVSINELDSRLAVDYDDTGTNHCDLESRLKKLGYEVTAQSSENHAM